DVKKNDKCCDIGTGCGIIPFIWIKNKVGKKIYGLDIQENAIIQCNDSIKKLKDKIDFDFTPILQDIKDIDKLKENITPGSLDVVCCNPPYKTKGAGIISKTECEKIARHETLCTIDDICKSASIMLKFGGKFIVCQRPERLADVIEAMRKNGIEPKRLRFAAKNKDKAPWLFLLEGKKGSKPFMKVLPTLLTRIDDKTFTEEMLKIYGKK
ncbi:MAG: methyltransferase domain-containing protein, partial [Oscillospiraceae bacterium]